jgi:hypothetical protein
MDSNSESLSHTACDPAQTESGTPTNEVVGNAKLGTSETHVNPLCESGTSLSDETPSSSRMKAAYALRQGGKLKVVPLHLWQANAVVSALHRHHSPIRVHKFSIGATLDGKLVGAAICMRPACRALDDGLTIEVCRLATDGTFNACSLLYSTCAKIARLMGYRRIQSYILDSEPGTSLKAAGWVLEKTGCGGTPQGKRTNRPNGHEVSPVTFMTKQRWAKLL